LWSQKNKKAKKRNCVGKGKKRRVRGERKKNNAARWCLVGKDGGRKSRLSKRKLKSNSGTERRKKDRPS